MNAEVIINTVLKRTNISINKTGRNYNHKNVHTYMISDQYILLLDYLPYINLAMTTIININHYCIYNLFLYIHINIHIYHLYSIWRQYCFCCCWSVPKIFKYFAHKESAVLFSYYIHVVVAGTKTWEKAKSEVRGWRGLMSESVAVENGK